MVNYTIDHRRVSRRIHNIVGFNSRSINLILVDRILKVTLRWSGLEEPCLATDRSHLLVIHIDRMIVVLDRVHIEVRPPLWRGEWFWKIILGGGWWKCWGGGMWPKLIELVILTYLGRLVVYNNFGLTLFLARKLSILRWSVLWCVRGDLFMVKILLFLFFIRLVIPDRICHAFRTR